MTVSNNVVVSGILDDEWAQTASPDDAFGSVTVNSGATLNLGDTGSGSSLTIPINLSNSSAFFRLVHP